jgi:ATP-binding cassette subfamily B protein
VILDEATSSVDTQTERLIQEAMNELLSGRSAIVIAHRLATVREVDRIIALEGGQIVEEGTHEELLAADGLYSRLYHTQMALT